jgi:hypothetical protein
MLSGGEFLPGLFQYISMRKTEHPCNTWPGRTAHDGGEVTMAAAAHRVSRACRCLLTWLVLRQSQHGRCSGPRVRPRSSNSDSDSNEAHFIEAAHPLHPMGSANQTSDCARVRGAARIPGMFNTKQGSDTNSVQSSWPGASAIARQPTAASTLLRCFVARTAQCSTSTMFETLNTGPPAGGRRCRAFLCGACVLDCW